MPYAATLLVALGASALATRWVRDTALTRGWVDASQSSRKVHTKPIPRLGGVGLVAGFLAALLAAALMWPEAAASLRAQPLTLVAVVGGVSLALLGLADDFLNLRARHKLLVQLAVAFGAWALGVRVEWLGAPFGMPQDLGLLSLPVTMFWVVGVVNAVNLIDGLDGLAAGVALFATLVCLALGLMAGDLVSVVLALALVGTLLGFLVFNFNPASIFMGDTGSMFLGFLLAVLSLRTAGHGQGAAAVLVPVVLLGLPLLDTTLAITRRAAMGRPVFSADKEHVHHRVMRRFGLKHRDTVLVLYAVCAVLGAAAFGLAHLPATPAALVLAGVVVAICAFLRSLGSLDLRAMEQLARARARNLTLRREVRAVVSNLGQANSMDDVTERLNALVPTLSASLLVLRLDGDIQMSVAGAGANGSAPSRTAKVAVRHGTSSLGVLEAYWNDGRTEMDRDEEIGLEEVAHVLGPVIGRISSGPVPAMPAAFLRKTRPARLARRTVA